MKDSFEWHHSHTPILDAKLERELARDERCTRLHVYPRVYAVSAHQPVSNIHAHKMLL